jgi:Tfp pilus assembly protein PilO
MKKMTLNNIYEWPLMTRLLLLGLVFVTTFYLGYRYDVSWQISALSHAIQQEQDIKQELELVIHKNKMSEQEILRLPTLKKELAKWDKQLINSQDLPELLNQILKIGADNHLFVSSFTPGEAVKIPLFPWLLEAPNGDVSMYNPQAAAPAAPDPNAATQPAQQPITFTKVPIKVVIVGDYHEISDFISQVANLPWIVSVSNFTITNEDETSLLGDKLAKQAVTQHLLSAEMTLEIYTLPESK